MSQIPNKDNINVAPNEILNTYTINRNFNKLLENDIFLEEMAIKIFQSIVQLNEYSSVINYQKGEYVFFKTIIDDQPRVFLLQSLIDNNYNNEPKLQYDSNNNIFFGNYWANKFQTLIKIDDEIKKYCRNYFANQLNINHINETNHKYGELSSINDLDNKILKVDFSNIDKNRNTMFFPFETITLEPDNVIKSGFYRKWDNGLIEYDIIFRLGYNGKELYKGVEYDKIECNNLIINSNINTVKEGDEDYFNNDKYFLSHLDKCIFNLEKSGNFSIINGMKQNNTNQFINTYSATIKFPVTFIDLNYMIFTSEITRQERNKDQTKKYSGSNTITFVNKCRKSISPVYITYPLTDDPSKAGIFSNTFHCQIIGKWK